MPNFRAKDIKNSPLPFSWAGVDFIARYASVYKQNESGDSLILAKTQNVRFFLQLKKFKDGYIIKAEKISRPADASLVQCALNAFKEHEAIGLINEAIASKPSPALPKENVWDLKEAIELLASPKNILLNNKTPKSIILEIGFGSGRQLLHLAKTEPESLVIGLEIYKPAIAQASKLARLQGLNNIRCICADARTFLSMLPSNSLDSILLHFPVPWDKAPHRRVASPSFAFECERVLKQKASFWLRTDEEDYALYTAKSFLCLGSPSLRLAKNADPAVLSKYEARWRRLNKNIYDMFYTCEQESPQKMGVSDLIFDGDFDTKGIILNFKPVTKVYESCFFHLERLYVLDGDEAFVRLSMGSFNAPAHLFIHLSKSKISYFKAPLSSDDNIKAHKYLQEFLRG